jgi:4-amino-4-deoxy-L-arabinose transferase-like glycosyltransferase
MPRSSRIMLIALIAFAAAFRAKGLFANTFQPDEALFASWARYIATWRDPLLVGQLVDKPPLLFYLQALFFRLFGPEMWAARLPAFIASLALIPMTAQLAWRLYQSETTMLLAAAIVVSSPMAIQYSASGFIDPLTSFLLVGMLVLVADFRAESSGRIQDTEKRIQDWAPILAGVFFGLAALSKFQAWLFIPLMVALAMIVGWRRAQWRNWLIGLLPFLGLQVAWELLRTGKLALLEAQLQSYGGLRLSWSWELWPRLNAWADQWAYILKSPVLELMLLLALPLIAALLLEQHDRKAALDRLFVLYVVAHTLLLWFVAVPVWDRYLLALLPIISLVLSRAIERAIGYILLATSEVVMFPQWTRRLIVLAPLALLGLQASPIAAAY